MTGELAPFDEWDVWRDDFADGGDRWYARNEDGELIHAGSAVGILETIAGWVPAQEFPAPPFRRNGALL